MVVVQRPLLLRLFIIDLVIGCIFFNQLSLLLHMLHLLSLLNIIPVINLMHLFIQPSNHLCNFSQRLLFILTAGGGYLD